HQEEGGIDPGQDINEVSCIDATWQSHREQAAVPTKWREPPPPQGTEPGATVPVVEQLRSSGSFVPFRVVIVRQRTGNTTLETNELGSGEITSIFQVIGEDEPGAIVVGFFLRLPEKCEQVIVHVLPLDSVQWMVSRDARLVTTKSCRICARGE